MANQPNLVKETRFHRPRAIASRPGPDKKPGLGRSGESTIFETTQDGLPRDLLQIFPLSDLHQ
ncbi:MAG: hypothetical protein GDA43_10305 [Hormoscilla sp. SP5CHS1]|nr:hypothetical protein [Hormoscilla sp. SP12CHS1]MBC6453551.1 hypothetical protein [Hormoscilla sp. SP5CHS1]